MSAPSQPAKTSILGVLLAIVIPLSGGLIGSALYQDRDWFEALEHPVWRPPNWLFAPVWTVLYVLMGIASYYVYRDGTDLQTRWVPLCIYGVKLIVNWLWTPLFFVWHLILAALVDIIILWLLLVLTLILFWRTKRLSGILLIPYLTWVTIATALNANYYYLNR